MRRFDWCQQTLLGACMILLPLLGFAQTTSWNDWLASQIHQHPDVLAAQKKLMGSRARAEAAEQPIYNPEFSAEVERSGEENNYQVGIQQTIDWWDLRDARQRQAADTLSAAEAQYMQQLLDHTALAIDALIEWDAANRAASIAKEQQQQLSTMLKLVERRLTTGDLSSIDAELTFLSLSQQLPEVAQVEASLRSAELKVIELLPQWTPDMGGVPESFWPLKPNSITDQELLKHPAVAWARARWLSLKQEAEVIRLSTKATPTFGINAGRDEDENSVGLTFSIPLNVRNNFSAEISAAESDSQEAESNFRGVYRKQRITWQTANATWNSYQLQFRRWQELAEGRVEKSAQLLERQWISGDLSTTDYLLALNQRAESLLAGIELEKQTLQARNNILKQSGFLMSTAMPNSKSTNH